MIDELGGGRTLVTLLAWSCVLVAVGPSLAFGFVARQRARRAAQRPVDLASCADPRGRGLREATIRDRDRDGRADVGLDDELVVMVVYSAVQSGAPMLRALAAAGSHLGGDVGQGMVRFCEQVQMGATWQEAAVGCSGVLVQLLGALEPAWRHGASARVALQRLAEKLRKDRTARAERVAARLSVRLVIPLGVCFLPAFVLLGLVPLGVSFMGSF